MKAVSSHGSYRTFEKTVRVNGKVERRVRYRISKTMLLVYGYAVSKVLSKKFEELEFHVNPKLFLIRVSVKEKPKMNKVVVLDRSFKKLKRKTVKCCYRLLYLYLKQSVWEGEYGRMFKEFEMKGRGIQH